MLKNTCLDPLLIVRNIRVALRLENQAAEVAEVVDVVIQVRDVVGDVLQRRVLLLQALLVELAYPIECLRN